MRFWQLGLSGLVIVLVQQTLNLNRLFRNSMWKNLKLHQMDRLIIRDMKSLAKEKHCAWMKSQLKLLPIKILMSYSSTTFKTLMAFPSRAHTSILQRNFTKLFCLREMAEKDTFFLRKIQSQKYMISSKRYMTNSNSVYLNFLIICNKWTSTVVWNGAATLNCSL